MRKIADISPCGTYRYKLGRIWDESLPTLNWIMLNPSIADAIIDDPTIRRVIRFSQDNGYGRAIVCNLFALRATNPDELKKHPNPRGNGNDTVILGLSGDIVCAWGSNKFAERQAKHIIRILDRPLLCLGTTNSGSPKHPLYVSASTRLVNFDGHTINSRPRSFNTGGARLN